MNQDLLFKIIIGVGLAFFAFRFLVGAASRVSSEDAREAVKAGATLLDVRSPGEFSGGHLKGAKNIPVQVLKARAAELPQGKPVVVYCRSGARSSQAARILKSLEFDVKDLGPMSAW